MLLTTTFSYLEQENKRGALHGISFLFASCLLVACALCKVLNNRFQLSIRSFNFTPNPFPAVAAFILFLSPSLIHNGADKLIFRLGFFSRSGSRGRNFLSLHNDAVSAYDSMGIVTLDVRVLGDFVQPIYLLCELKRARVIPNDKVDHD
jgi:hypothetical protein